MRYLGSRLCAFGIHHKVDRREWFGPCRRCGLPLFGRNIPITSEQTLRVYIEKMEALEAEQRFSHFGGR